MNDALQFETYMNLRGGAVLYWTRLFIWVGGLAIHLVSGTRQADPLRSYFYFALKDAASELHGLRRSCSPSVSHCLYLPRESAAVQLR